jgi:hypothetical protein
VTEGRGAPEAPTGVLMMVVVGRCVNRVEGED